MAGLTPHGDRQTALAIPSLDHLYEIEHRPAVAILAVGRQLVVVLQEAGEGTEVDHLASQGATK